MQAQNSLAKRAPACHTVPDSRRSAKRSESAEKLEHEPPNTGDAVPTQPLTFTPEQFPDPWLFDTNALLKELDRVRQLILMIPLHQDTFGPTDTATRAVWELQERLRYLLRLRAEMMQSWQAKA